MKKKPSAEDIQAMLNEGHFADPHGALPAADPIVPTQMLLSIDQIKAYDRNPRQERNPLYDEIKESIRAQGGLNNPLTVTRRPGEDFFMVESGGNTRLEVLKELWQETADERFFRIHCLFRPWVSESHVLAAHLIENDKRGELTFIDRALGVMALRDELEREHQCTFRQRELVEALNVKGYGINQTLLSRMIYAVEVMLPAIPQALRAGLGVRAVRDLRRVESAARALWEKESGKHVDAFDVLFRETLTEHDGPELIFEAVQRELEVKMTEALNWPLTQVRLVLDATLSDDRAHPSGALPVEPVLPAPPPAPTPSEPNAGVVPIRPGADIPDQRTQALAAPVAKNADEDPAKLPPAVPWASAFDASQSNPPCGHTPSIEPTSDEVTNLRECAHTLARRLAERHGIEECIAALPHHGMGFLVDLPINSVVPVAADNNDATDQLYRQWLWWLLLSLSEAAVHPDRIATVPDGVHLKRLILEQRDHEALSLVGEPDWKALGYEFLSNPGVPGDTLAELLELMGHCRAVRRRTGDDGGLTLWQPAPES